MKYTLLTAVGLAGLASAAPTAQFGGFDFGSLFGGGRNNAGGSSSASGACKDVTFIFARGSTETGTLGTVIGPPVSNGLQRKFPNQVTTIGVDYAAGLGTNAGPNNADPRGVTNMKADIQQTAQRCPQTKIVVGGYSQGAAVTHQAVEELTPQVRNRIAGAVTFGDTRNQQDRGQIPNYPKDRTKIFCNAGDAVCRGTLSVGPAHLTYGSDAGAAVDFLAQQIAKGPISG